MNARYATLAVYSLCLAIAAGAWLSIDLGAHRAFPPLWVVAPCIAASLFVWQFGVRAPR